MATIRVLGSTIKTITYQLNGPKCVIILTVQIKWSCINQQGTNVGVHWECLKVKYDYHNLQFFVEKYNDKYSKCGREKGIT